MASLTVYATNYDGTRSSFHSNTNTNTFDNIYNQGDSSTSTGRFYWNTGDGVSSNLLLLFDTSDLPRNIKITKVTGSIKVKLDTATTSYYTAATVQIMANNIGKGSSVSYNNSASIKTLDGGIDWTRNELNDLCINVSVTRGSNGVTYSRYTDVYGCTITITYEELGDDLALQSDFYYKQNGIWIYASSFDDCIDKAQNYIVSVLT